MIVRALFCHNCKTVVFSRARNDLAACECGKSFIDGGRDHIRVGRHNGANHKLFDLELPEQMTEEYLYSDWNNGTHKEGFYTAPYPDWITQQLSCQKD